ncbi:MAG: hypothetical protein V3U34_00730 [candidate division NC10 bacterium]
MAEEPEFGLPEHGPNYEPAHHNREYYRHAVKGDRAYMFRRGGQKMIRYDRPQEIIEVTFKKHEWVKEVDARPMTLAQVTKVAFAADHEICLLLGMHDQGRRGWLDLSDNQRIEWMEEGPSNSPTRERVYAAIMSIMREMVD